jgi:hypothetical protein
MAQAFLKKKTQGEFLIPLGVQGDGSSFSEKIKINKTRASF